MSLDEVKAKNLKKIIHNKIERRRKQIIFDLIEEIIETLPFKHELKNKSKSEKLKQVLKYIIDLRNKNDALMFANPDNVFVQEIKFLRKQIVDLEKINLAHQDLLKSAGISTNHLVDVTTTKTPWRKPLKYSVQTNCDTHRINSDTDDNEGDDDEDMFQGKSKKSKTDHLSQSSLISINGFTSFAQNQFQQQQQQPKLMLTNGCNIISTSSQLLPSSISNIGSTITGTQDQKILLITPSNGTMLNLALPVQLASTSCNSTKLEYQNSQVIDQIDRISSKTVKKSNKVDKSIKSKSPIDESEIKEPCLTTTIEKSTSLDDMKKPTLAENEIVFIEMKKQQVVEPTLEQSMNVDKENSEIRKSSTDSPSTDDLRTRQKSNNIISPSNKTIDIQTSDQHQICDKENSVSNKPASLDKNLSLSSTSDTTLLDQTFHSEVLTPSSQQQQSKPNSQISNNSMKSTSASYYTASLLQNSSESKSAINEKQRNYENLPQFLETNKSVRIETPTFNSSSVSGLFRFNSIKDSIPMNSIDSSISKISDSVVDDSTKQHHRSLYSFSDSDYHSATIYNDFPTSSSLTLPNDSNRLSEPTNSNLILNNVNSKPSFGEMSSFGMMPQTFSSTGSSSSRVGALTTSSSSSFHYQHDSSYSNSSNMFGTPSNQNPFPPPPPPFLPPSASTFFDSNVFNSPHKNSSAMSSIRNHSASPSSSANSVFNIDFNSSLLGSNLSQNLETSSAVPELINSRYSNRKTSATISSSSSSVGVPNNVVRQNNKKSNSSLPNKNMTSNRKTFSKKATNNTASGFSFPAQTKRNSNDSNHFLIPDMIFPPASTNTPSIVTNSATHQTAYNLFGSTSVNEHNANYSSSRDLGSISHCPESSVSENNNNDDGQQLQQSAEISSCYPIIFRPQNVTSANLSLTTSTNSNSYLRSSYNSSGSLYYPGTSSSTSVSTIPSSSVSTTSSTSHLPNFNLSNILDISLTSSSSSSSSSVPVPVNSSSPYYLPSASVDLNSKSFNSNPYKNRFSSTGSMATSNSVPHSSAASGFAIPKFSPALPTVTTTSSSSSSSSKSTVVSVDSLTNSSSTANEKTSLLYGHHHHHHHHSTPTQQHHNQGHINRQTNLTENHHSSSASAASTSTNYQHFYSGPSHAQHHNFVSSSGSNRLRSNNPGSSTFSSHSGDSSNVLIESSVMPNDSRSTNYSLVPPPPRPTQLTTPTNDSFHSYHNHHSHHHHGSSHPNSFSQCSFNFAYPPPPPPPPPPSHIQSVSIDETIHQSSAETTSSVSSSLMVNQMNSSTHHHHSHQYSQHYHQPTSSSASSSSASLGGGGSFDRMSNSTKSITAANSNSPATTPHPHISFSLFNLPRTDKI